MAKLNTTQARASELDAIREDLRDLATRIDQMAGAYTHDRDANIAYIEAATHVRQALKHMEGIRREDL